MNIKTCEYCKAEWSCLHCSYTKNVLQNWKSWKEVFFNFTFNWWIDLSSISHKRKKYSLLFQKFLNIKSLTLVQLHINVGTILLYFSHFYYENNTKFVFIFLFLEIDFNFYLINMFFNFQGIKNKSYCF